jgi:hypothetical protein
MLTEKTEKNRKKYSCEKCDFFTCDKSAFGRHCSTRKHILLTQSEKTDDQKTERGVCSNCGKVYKSKQGLWSHSKVCQTGISNEIVVVSNDNVSDNAAIKNYIIKLVEQNAQLQNMIIEQNNKHNQELATHNTELQEIKTMLAEQPAPMATITNIQNNKTINNTQFNLTVFLQERCKDALNMSQFIDTLQINTQSVEYTGAHGYVNGITKIFMDGLNQLDIHERPIHCTDLKRETLYIKENDKWEKDTEEKTKFKHALATVVNRNVAQVSHWEKENPRSQIPETDEYEFYFDIVRQSLGGGNHDVTARNNDKIMRAIAGKVYLDKKTKEIQ